MFFRLYVRVKVVREPGWDDFFVVLSAVRYLVVIITLIRLLTVTDAQHGSHCMRYKMYVILASID